MKNLKTILLASVLTVGVFSSTLFTSCNQDKCKNVTCNNGGVCNETDGSCTCAAGFEGTNCETESRTKVFGSFLLSGTDSDGGTYTNLATSVTTSAAAKNKFLLNIAGAFVLTCTMTGTNNFTIDNVTLGGFTYTGNGSYNGTTLSITMNEVDASGTVVYNLSGNKQ